MMAGMLGVTMAGGTAGLIHGAPMTHLMATNDHLTSLRPQVGPANHVMMTTRHGPTGQDQMHQIRIL